MIKINNRVISTVVVSTILGHYGRGMFPYNIISPSYRKVRAAIKATKTTILTKSSTLVARQGNYSQWKPWTWGCVRDLPNMGMLNAYGLTNPGVEICAREIMRSIKAGYNVIPNFFPDFQNTLLAAPETELAIMIMQHELKDKLWAIELNFSCPNDKVAIEKNIANSAKLVKRLKKTVPWLVIIAKTSIVHPYEFLQELELAGVDIFHLINSIPYNALFENQSPLRHLGGGGVSGGPAFAAALKYVSGARKVIKKDIIAGCGAVTINNFRRYREVGANSVSICAGIVKNTRQMTDLIKIHNSKIIIRRVK